MSEIILPNRNIEFVVKSVSVLGRNKKRKEIDDYFYEDAERNIYVVADGLGGHGGGREASRLTVQSVADQLTELYERLKKADYSPNEIERKIKAAIEYTNSQIIHPIAEFSKNLQNIGTTLVTFFYYNGFAYVHNVGDSHAFLYGNVPDGTKDLTQLTEDDRIKRGYEKCSEEELKVRLLGARMKQYVGEEGIDVHPWQVYVNDGDIFLLTTDGLLDPVCKSEIAEILSDEYFDEIPDMLVDRANSPEKMLDLYHQYTGKTTVEAFDKLAGKDDITFILLKAREAGQSASC